MATSKVESRPPSAHPSPFSTCKSELNFCGLSSGGKRGSRLDASFLIQPSNLHVSSRHWVFRASSFPPAQLPSAKLWESVHTILTVDCDCRSCNQPKGVTTKVTDDGLVGYHSRHQSLHLGPTISFYGSGFNMPEPLLTLNCNMQGRGHCPHVDSQNCAKVGRQLACTGNGSTEAKENVYPKPAQNVPTLLPDVRPHQEGSRNSSCPAVTSGCSRESGDVISGSHRADEIVCGGHVPDYSIHSINGDRDIASEYHSSCGHLEECKPSPSICISKPSDCGPTPSQTKTCSSAKDCHLKLKKLLSDESGFCEALPSETCSSPCEWSSKDFTDSEDWDDWDDDDCTDGEHECNEMDELLWKSFEDCALSPQTLYTKSPADSAKCTKVSSLSQQATDKLTSGHSGVELNADRNEGACSHSNLNIISPLGDHVTTMVTQSHCTDVSTPSQVTEYLPQHSSQSKCCSYKRVRFPSDSSISVVHEIIAWSYAYRAARKGPWETYARDRAHFRRKIDQLALVIEPCLVRKITNGNTYT